ncbi:acyltransferase family protein [Sporomusa malonica]|uniref:Peptidoglycan/LPS O-acetylase OafA/YrhL, contains acyltransferase and SGNH-hydrolase domains n=1 Tax=Sporomusa malonica TaxID=112901 RepID=A0A1W2DL26_9FIRM|nr:acyltransferase [Sporomusa malonica]SMC98141.1 Peptidoglycan/LPS O-acetylase OafA/YrhL, contains acyltransferase and SGNH-hydrolase domains [Sporomusa malonica]
MKVVKNDSRIAFLDGLRGVAILLVVLFHAYANRPDLVPFGDTFAKFPVFAYGWLGVQLFFIISGFVIFMTLEKCHSFQEFILRRWLRLFPAMLICSIIILGTAPFLPERPAGVVFYRDLLPGLTFIAPDWWAKLLGFQIRSIEGSFWSLYVEVKFYVIFGTLYFVAGWRKALVALIGFFCLSTIIVVVKKAAPTLDMHLMSKILGLADARYYGWFAVGALYYKYFREQRTTLLLYAMIIGFISALVEVQWHPRYSGLGWQPTFFVILIVVFFTVAITNTRVQALLTRPSLLFIGFISYPLYLLHDNMMVAMIIKMGHQIPLVYGILIPLLPIAMVMGISWFVANYIEPWTREQIRLPYNRLCTLIGAVRSVNSAPSKQEILK